MKAPTLEEIVKQFNVKGIDDMNEAEKFLNYYESLGWKIRGKYPIRSWKACVNGWITKMKDFNPSKHKESFTYQEVVFINNDRNDKRTFSQFERTDSGTWVLR